MAGGVHGRGMYGGACMVGHGRGHAWQGACMAEDVHGRGCAWSGACVAVGCVWWGACMVGGIHGRGHAWQRGMHGRGWGNVWQGHAWQGCGWWGACVAGEMATIADVRHLTGMHSCWKMCLGNMRMSFVVLLCVLRIDFKVLV